MLAYYAEGAIGFVMAILGVIGIVVGIITIDLTPNEAWYYIGAGLVLSFAGGYLRFLSRQTVRIRDPFIGPQAGHLVTYPGPHSLEDAGYREFLTKKYHINNRNLLNRYVLHAGLFETEDEALMLARKIEEELAARKAAPESR